MKKKIDVVQSPEQPVAASVIASSIVEIDKHMNAALTAGLRAETIVSLIHDRSGIAKKTIRIVINNLSTMRETYTTRKA